jgi:hypothetical protein
MRKWLLVLISFTAFAQGFSQDCLWIGTGLGISTAPRSVMVHLPLGMTFLRHNRWGIAFSLDYNGRTRNADVANSLHAFGGGNLCGTWNFFPYNEAKLLVRAGISRGEYTYLRDQLPAASNGDAVFVTDRITTNGCFLSLEGIVPSQRKDYRSWSIECFANIMKRTYVGVCLKYNLGNVS